MPEELAVTRKSDGGQVHCMVFRQADALAASPPGPQPSLLWIHGISPRLLLKQLLKQDKSHAIVYPQAQHTDANPSVHGWGD